MEQERTPNIERRRQVRKRGKSALTPAGGVWLCGHIDKKRSAMKTILLLAVLCMLCGCQTSVPQAGACSSEDQAIAIARRAAEEQNVDLQKYERVRADFYSSPLGKWAVGWFNLGGNTEFVVVIDGKTGKIISAGDVPVQPPPPIYSAQPPPPPRVKSWTWDRQALVADTIHFSFDSVAIRGSEKGKLQAVAAVLKLAASVQLMIEGNGDEPGSEEYNRGLGERRAQAAREALAEMGIDRNRIHTISYGKDKPVDSGHYQAVFGPEIGGMTLSY